MGLRSGHAWASALHLSAIAIQVTKKYNNYLERKNYEQEFIWRKASSVCSSQTQAFFTIGRALHAARG